MTINRENSGNSQHRESSLTQLLGKLFSENYYCRAHSKVFVQSMDCWWRLHTRRVDFLDHPLGSHATPT